MTGTRDYNYVKVVRFDRDRFDKRRGQDPSGEKGDKQLSPCKCYKQQALCNGDKRGGQAPVPQGPTCFYNTLILFT